MRELLRHFVIFTAISIILVLLAVAAFMWVAESETECISNGGFWNVAIEWCERD